jgi:phospholipase C
MKRKPPIVALALILLLAAVLGGLAIFAMAMHKLQDSKAAQSPATPIQHLVVLFQENVSFDHYFGKYPNAKNPTGEPQFHATSDTPPVNGLTEALLTRNPGGTNPRRLSRSEALTCDQDHEYANEQKAYNHGLVNKFVEYANGKHCTDKTMVMNYFDGNTVTAYWNYAQHYALNDNSFGTTFGPSTLGAINLVSGQTSGATPADVPDMVTHGTLINDAHPAYDDCSTKTMVSLKGKNVGDLLNEKNITWGWFQGGFRPTGKTSDGEAVCDAEHKNIGGAYMSDYLAHHEPFQYYKSTANPHHLPPTALDKVGQTDQANHQYDLQDFWSALDQGTLPAVSYLKAPGYEDGHAGYSSPLDEQRYIVDAINHLQKSKFWESTAVILAYDDSDGWYDHVMPPIVNGSATAEDSLSGEGRCGEPEAGAYQGRCGYGPRLPLLVISPYAKKNFVDHTLTDQTSILRFIEDNWQLGRIGDQSFDVIAGRLNDMFDFAHPRQNDRLALDPAIGVVK